ncbi:MAG: PaaI family thioesterase [Steroidobacteraceae bacterium]|jgi:uncharacterized protein (TIGR00369 family)
MSTDELPSLTLERIQQSLDESPFQRPFRFRVLSFDSAVGVVEIQMDFVPAAERTADTRQFHGGAIASLIDIAGDYALFARLGHGVPTIDLRIDYLRPAIDTGLIARAVVRRVGRTIGVVDIEVTATSGKTIALGRGTYGVQDR